MKQETYTFPCKRTVLLPKGEIERIKEMVTCGGMDLWYDDPWKLPEEIRYCYTQFDFETYMCCEYCPLGIDLKNLGKCKDFVNWYKQECEKSREKEVNNG